MGSSVDNEIIIPHSSQLKIIPQDHRRAIGREYYLKLVQPFAIICLFCRTEADFGSKKAKSVHIMSRQRETLKTVLMAKRLPSSSRKKQ